ncbi:unnamed protein product, partial [Allacma fusca]
SDDEETMLTSEPSSPGPITTALAKMEIEHVSSPTSIFQTDHHGVTEDTAMVTPMNLTSMETQLVTLNSDTLQVSEETSPCHNKDVQHYPKIPALMSLIIDPPPSGPNKSTRSILFPTSPTPSKFIPDTIKEKLYYVLHL